jgi:hypothetical protein
MITYTSGVTPTTYMSYASWLGAQGLSKQTLEGGTSATMAAYNAWLAGLPSATSAATTTPVTTTPVTTTPTTTTPTTTIIPTTAMPSLGSINVPAPAVTPAPAYEISPEQKAWEEKVSGYLSETLEMGGRGYSEETMALMTQKTTDTLKAKETEDIRVMRNNMERRGITNSGFVFSNEQKIRSGTTVAIANSITDLNIQNALMKVASFETAMGQAAQFLSYLGEQTQLKNEPAYQTWQAQQQANLYQYQAEIDLYKTQLQQAYAQNNMVLAGQIASAAATQQNAWDVEMAEMEIEAANQQAAAEGAGNLLGTTIGGIFGML